MIRLALAVVAVVALGAVHVPEARAGGPDRATQAKAGALFERAQKHFQAGEYNDAIKLFAEAYELVHDPVYLFNLAQSYRKVLDCVKASDYYERYLAEAGDIDAKQRERVEQWLREIAPCVQQRRGEAELARRAEDAEQVRRAEALRRQREEASRPREIDRGRPYRIAGIAAAGVGAVGLGLGGFFTARSSRLKAQVAEQCNKGCDWEQWRDEDAAGRRANTIAVIGWVGGGITLGGGVALYLLGRSRIEHVQLAPVQGGATLSARLAF